MRLSIRTGTLKGVVTGAVALGALLVCAIDAQAAIVNLQFNLNTAGPGPINVVNSISETQSGITWTATGQAFLSPGTWQDARVNQDLNGLGVSNIGNGNDPDINGQGHPERLGLLFSPSVVIDTITFTGIDAAFDGDQFILFYSGGGGGQTAATAIGGTGTVTFNLTGLLTVAQRTGGQFYVATTDGDDDFRVSGVQINAAAIPLPPAAWMGFGMLGAMALIARARRRKADLQ